MRGVELPSKAGQSCCGRGRVCCATDLCSSTAGVMALVFEHTSFVAGLIKLRTVCLAPGC
jgi:hypothetical protein